MNKDLTEIVCIVDRSGSMSSIAADVIGGLNTFIGKNKELPGSANLTLVLFDHMYDVVYSGDVKNCPVITNELYYARGNTAMFDAIGRTINDVGIRLGSYSEEARPSKVIVCIMTDGEENGSRIYTAQRVQEMVKHQTDVYSWEFIFLGANIDTAKTSTGLGMSATRSASSFKANSRGVDVAFTAYSCALSDVRSKGVMADASLYMAKAEADVK